MAIKFCYDTLGTNPALGYPNLARPDLASDQFDSTWPCCTPLRLLMYLQRSSVSFRTYTVEQAPPGSWYPVAMSWHDHSLDYFSLMSAKVHQRLKQKHIKILFYYHEGDDPHTIKTLMDHRVADHDLPSDCYFFVSANSQAQNLENFWYFGDHEHFFQYVNRRQSLPTISQGRRPYEFTALSRTHKWWRASVMSDLWRSGLLDHSQWSYNTDCVIHDQRWDNPIRIYETPGWAEDLERFIASGPYRCDSPDDQAHNDHRAVNLDLYSQSYCHLVIETHFDADGSQGSFLTEKTYKCLKFGQPFIIIGTPGSLEVLRQQGYRVFDHVIDNDYDRIQDNTQRWQAIKHVVQDLRSRDLLEFLQACESDMLHNQSLFMQTQKPDLLALAQYLDTVG